MLIGHCVDNDVDVHLQNCVNYVDSKEIKKLKCQKQKESTNNILKLLFMRFTNCEATFKDITRPTGVQCKGNYWSTASL